MSSLFLFGSQSDDTDVLSESSEALPVENIQNTKRSKPWRSSSGTTSNISLQLANPLSVDHIAFVDLNLTTAGEIRIQAWDDAIDGSTNTVDETISPTVYTSGEPEAAAYGDADYGVGLYGLNTPIEQQLGKNITIFPIGSNISSAYWKFTFTDDNTGYQQLGRLIMASATTFENNLSHGYNLSRQERSVARESIGGQRYIQKRPSRLNISGKFPYMTDVEKIDFLLKYQDIVNSDPFVYSVYPTANNKGLVHTLYGRFDSVDLSEIFYQRTDLDFKVIEEL